jgi:hypothetical protein
MNLKSYAHSLFEKTKAVFANIYFLTAVGSVVFLWMLATGGGNWVGYVALAALFVGGYFAVIERDYVNRQIAGLSKYTIRLEDDALLQLDESGEEVGRIDLSAEFSVSVPYRTGGAGIIRVIQGDRTLDFPSTLPEAESIARTALGFEQWPPEARWNPPF